MMLYQYHHQQLFELYTNMNDEQEFFSLGKACTYGVSPVSLQDCQHRVGGRTEDRGSLHSAELVFLCF